MNHPFCVPPFMETSLNMCATFDQASQPSSVRSLRLARPENRTLAACHHACMANDAAPHALLQSLACGKLAHQNLRVMNSSCSSWLWISQESWQLTISTCSDLPRDWMSYELRGNGAHVFCQICQPAWLNRVTPCYIYHAIPPSQT